MNNPRLAQRYAKSLIDISSENNQLDEVRNDIVFLQQILKSSREFVAMLNSPVIKTDKKYKIIAAVTEGRISAITQAFLKLLCNKNREDNLPGILSAYLQQYNKLKGLHTATLTTAAPVSEEMIENFKSRIKASSNISNLTLETKVNESLIGGFVLEMGGKMIDASILRDLKDVKKQFANNDYLHRIR